MNAALALAAIWLGTNAAIGAFLVVRYGREQGRTQ